MLSVSPDVLKENARLNRIVQLKDKIQTLTIRRITLMVDQPPEYHALSRAIHELELELHALERS